MIKKICSAKACSRLFLMTTIALSIAGAGAGLGSMLSCSRWSGSKPMAKVGSYLITEKDVEYRNQVSRVFYPDQTAQTVGLEQLISAYTQAEIFRKYRRSLDVTVLEAEASRIDANSKDPKGLSRIKNIFGNDRQSYLNLFVLPTLVERAIYFDLFLNNQAIHLATRKAAETFLKEARSSPALFKALAQKHSLQYRRAQLSFDSGLTSEETTKPRPAEKAQAIAPENRETENPTKQLTQDIGNQLAASQLNEAREWLQTYIMPARTGEVIPEIIHHPDAWILMRRLSWNQKKNTYAVEMAVMPKTEFTRWLEQETKSVAIERF